MKLGRGWLVNIVLSLGVIALMLLALEGIVRVWPRYPVKLPRRSYIEFDPLLGWRKRPGSQDTCRLQDYVFNVKINSHGLRDIERAYESRPGVVRLLALGDSFTEAYSVALEEMHTQVLETSLRRGGLAAEVINGGTQAYGTDQEYLFYLTQGRRYSPRVVLLLFYYNDIFTNTHRHSGSTPKPVFALDINRLALDNVPVKEREEKPGPEKTESSERGSALWNLIRTRLYRGAPRAYNRLAALGLWRPADVMPTPFELKVFRRRYIPEVFDAWQHTEKLFAALQRSVSEDGARLLIVYIPSKMEVSDRIWRLNCDHYGWNERSMDRDLVTAQLRRISASIDVPWLDLTPALRRAEGGALGKSSYYPNDNHWNAKGHRIAAAEIERYLRNEGWLTPGAAAPTRTASDTWPAWLHSWREADIPRQPATVPLLLRAMESQDWDVRMKAAWALGVLGPLARAAAPRLVAALNDAPFVTRFARRALVRIGPDALPHVIGALKNDDPLARANAADVLAAMGRAAAPALTMLERGRADPQVLVRYRMIHAIHEIEQAQSEAGTSF